MAFHLAPQPLALGDTEGYNRSHDMNFTKKYILSISFRCRINLVVTNLKMTFTGRAGRVIDMKNQC